MNHHESGGLEGKPTFSIPIVLVDGLRYLLLSTLFGMMIHGMVDDTLETLGVVGYTTLKKYAGRPSS
jgi:hypothetical protein